MTYLEELHLNIDMTKRLMDALTMLDVSTKEGKTMRRILITRRQRYEYLIECFHTDVSCPEA